jgi:hypothetical protein
MRYAVAIFTIAALAVSAPAQGKTKDRAPRFADYPVTKPVTMRVAKPKFPKGEIDDAQQRLLDTVAPPDVRTNFAGRYFLAVVGCGSTCVWGAIVYPKSGRVVGVPTVASWFETHDKFEAIDFRHNSRLIVLSGGRYENRDDMGLHYYVFENGKLRHLRTIKTGENFMEPNK